MNKSKRLIPFLIALISIQVAFNTAIASDSVAEYIIKSRLIQAEKGNADEQYKLASMYELGIGTDIDMQQATHWYSRATKTGYKDAEKRLSYIDIKKNGFNKKAHGKWLKKIKSSAKANDSESLMLLGQMYSYGLGVQKDMDEAFRLVNKANLDNPVVLFELDRIEKERRKVASLKKKRDAQAEKKRIEAEKQVVAKAKAAEKKKVLSKEERRRSYEATMQKIRDEQRILDEEQAWAEGKTAPKAKASDTKTASEKTMANARSQRYLVMMRKMKEEERIMNEQQAWAEAKQ